MIFATSGLIGPYLEKKLKYISYELSKPNELTIEKEKAMSMVNCVDHPLIPRTLYEELAKGFRDGFMKGMESVKYDWKDRFKVSLDGMPYEVLTAELKHELGEPEILRLECVKKQPISDDDKAVEYCINCKNRYPDSEPCRHCVTHLSAGKYPSHFTPYDPNYVINKVKKEKENMNTKIEKTALTDEDFRNNVTVKFGGKTCKIESACVAHHYNDKDEIGFRIVGTIPKFPSMLDKLTQAIEEATSKRPLFMSGGGIDSILRPYEIKDVRFNPPATIVFWQDGTKTVVKATNEDFDPEKGLAMAITKRLFGNKYEYFNQVKKWTKKYYKAHPAGDA